MGVICNYFAVFHNMVEQIIILFTLFAGYIVGLGAVTVIDLHGFLARKSSYWTNATIVSHKITKPLIWIGILLVLIGSTLFYAFVDRISQFSYIYWLIIFILILNGMFLSFWVSPRLIQREKEGRATELLPASWQNAITISFLISFVGWWGSLLLFIYSLVSQYNLS